ncbi:MAG: Epimerase family protein [Anaerolineales bacterium]|nr:Epimerase family protein [Anaerolineales bacterium]
MNVLIAGGSGLLGRALTRSLLADNHKVWMLTRSPERAVLPLGAVALGWDGRTANGWGHIVNEMDAVVNLAGLNMASWPWTESRKQAFWNSRIWAGQAVADAIRSATQRPRVLIQASGINFYGLRGEAADESTPRGDDFLSRLAAAWEFSSRQVEDWGVRRVVIRTAVVLSRENILMKLMEIPVQLFFGGRLGSGEQYLPWIHSADHVAAMRFLLDHERARGPFNLIAPESSTNAEFTRALARVMRRPYWFHVPAWLMRLPLGEMSMMILEGRRSVPRKLIETGYQFKFPALESALADLYRNGK